MAKAASGEGKAPLVIALVFFVLATIGLGVFAYTTSEDLTAANAAAAEAAKSKSAAEDNAQKAKEEAVIYKAALGLVSDPSSLQFRFKPEAKAVYAAMVEGIGAQADKAIQAQRPKFTANPDVPTLREFTATRADILNWSWPDDLSRLTPPAKSVIENAVAAIAQRELNDRESKTAKAYNDTAKIAMLEKSKEMDAAAKKFKDDTSKIPDVVAAERKTIKDSYDGKTKEFENAQIASRESFDKASANYGKTEIDLKKAHERIAIQERRINELLDKETDLIDPFQFDKPQGRILRRYSDSLVDIDLGTSDKLRAGIAFSIFPSDTIIRGMQPRNRAFVDNEGKVIFRPIPKGKVEVINVIGPNIAQCRIIDEDNAVRDRIIPGDLLYNALWRKGVSEHVALFGIFDIDGDGRDDTQALITGLKRVGVVVDAYYDFNKPNPADPSKPGGWIGEITSQTNFGVEGFYPTVSAADGNRTSKMEILGSIGRARAEVKEKGLLILRPRDFFPRIGYDAKLEVSEDAINQAATSLSRAANPNRPAEGGAGNGKN